MCMEKDPFANPPKEGKKITSSQDDAIAFSLNRTDQSKVRRLEEIRMADEGEAGDVGCLKGHRTNS